jgi:hypothetical protein
MSESFESFESLDVIVVPENIKQKEWFKLLYANPNKDLANVFSYMKKDILSQSSFISKIFFPLQYLSEIFNYGKPDNLFVRTNKSCRNDGTVWDTLFVLQNYHQLLAAEKDLGCVFPRNSHYLNWLLKIHEYDLFKKERDMTQIAFNEFVLIHTLNWHAPLEMVK